MSESYEYRGNYTRGKPEHKYTPGNYRHIHEKWGGEASRSTTGVPENIQHTRLRGPAALLLPLVDNLCQIGRIEVRPLERVPDDVLDLRAAERYSLLLQGVLVHVCTQRRFNNRRLAVFDHIIPVANVLLVDFLDHAFRQIKLQHHELGSHP